MEINITWNVCRVCLQEQNSSKPSTDIDADIAEQILEMTGVKIRANDSLPQKICSKCMQTLKQAVQFRKTCVGTNNYLHNILEKAKSFKLDKPNKIEFDDIIEEAMEEHEDFSSEGDIIQNTELVREDEEVLQSGKKMTVETIESDIIKSPAAETTSKANMDFESMFLLNDTKESEDFVDRLSKSAKGNIDEKTNLFDYDKSLSDSLDRDEDDAQDGVMQSAGNLSTVDIASNRDDDELFFIFSDEVITKQDDNDTRDETMLVENMSDMVDSITEASDEEGHFDAFIESDTNLLDQIDNTDENGANYVGMSRETTPNNENFYQDDFIVRTVDQYKEQYKQQNINELDKIEREHLIIKPAQPKIINFCQVCGNNFASRSLLKYHLRIVHRNERNYECELCGKRFTAACNLTTHMRIHTGEKPFECKYCQRRFSDKSTHVKHERSHTDERPYSCSVCQKAFTLSSSLKAHQRVHTGEKPHSCISCGKSFKLPHQLKAHMTTNAHKLRSEEEVITPN